MNESNVTKTILRSIEQAISEQPAGRILDSGEAFKIAQGIAATLGVSEAADISDQEKHRKVMSILRDAYPAARDLIAQQLRGMTFEGMIDTIKDARERFQGTRELTITPKPTLSYTGECEPLEPWNLYSNAIHAHLAGKEAKTALNWSEADENLSNKLEAVKQMLHFICQNEVKLADITGQPFDGTLTHQRLPMRLS